MVGPDAGIPAWVPQLNPVPMIESSDPYAYEKARFLSATFEFRIKLAIEARRSDMKQALDQLPDNLDRLWVDERYSARERRRILYELWYEMDNTPEGARYHDH